MTEQVCIAPEHQEFTGLTKEIAGKVLDIMGSDPMSAEYDITAILEKTAGWDKNNLSRYLKYLNLVFIERDQQYFVLLPEKALL